MFIKNCYITVGISLFIAVIFAIIQYQIPVMHWVDQNPFLNLILLNFAIIGLVIIPFSIITKGFTCNKASELKHRPSAFISARNVAHFSPLLKLIDKLGGRTRNG